MFQDTTRQALKRRHHRIEVCLRTSARLMTTCYSFCMTKTLLREGGPEGVKGNCMGFAHFQCWELGFSCLSSLGMGKFKDCDWDFNIFC